MNKKLLSLICCAAMLTSTMYAADNSASNGASAKTEEHSCQSSILAKLPKLSGYLQTGFNYTYQNGKSTSSFQAKRLRLLMDGKVSENIDFRLQIEAFNGIAGSINRNDQKTIQVMDAFATWKIMPEFKVRFGQFYTPLGYENYDISPATLETVDFSNIVYRMSCRNPYDYNFVDYGRDLGVMFMGDIGDSGKGFRYFHYDVALTNGSLPTSDDKNNYKDIYASFTVRPIKNLNFKATYNWGKYNTTNRGGGLGVPGGNDNTMHRFVAGGWYNDPKGLDIRSEFGLVKSKVGSTVFVDEIGAYVFAGYHLGKFLPMVRWDMYKDTVHNALAAANYNRILVGLTYELCKNVKFQLNYGHFFYSSTVPVKSMEHVQLMGIFKF